MSSFQGCGQLFNTIMTNMFYKFQDTICIPDYLSCLRRAAASLWMLGLPPATKFARLWAMALPVLPFRKVLRRHLRSAGISSCYKVRESTAPDSIGYDPKETILYKLFVENRIKGNYFEILPVLEIFILFYIIILYFMS